MIRYDLHDWGRKAWMAKAVDDNGDGIAIRKLLFPQPDGMCYEITSTIGAEFRQWREPYDPLRGNGLEAVRENLCLRYLQLRLDHDPIDVPADMMLTVINWSQPREPGDCSVHLPEDRTLPSAEAVDYLYMRAAQHYTPIERSDDPMDFDNLFSCDGIMDPEETIANLDRFNPYQATVVANGHGIRAAIQSDGTAWVRPDVYYGSQGERIGMALKTDRNHLAKAMLMLSTIDAVAEEHGVTVPTRDYVEGIIGEFDGYTPAAVEFIWG